MNVSARFSHAVKVVLMTLALCADLATAQTDSAGPAQTDSGQQVEPAETSGSATDGETGGASDLLEMDIEQLRRTSVSPSFEVEVSTVARQKSTVGRSAAAVYVITSDMIRRSGARNIPDLLRTVPGLNVARNDTSNWAITCRGFNSQFANKLLVQIDGRIIYSPLISGVYWNMQTLLLEDIERIEVIRGPGATIWGSNAVNGIISIITKSAKDTQGLYAHAGSGSEERLFSAVRAGGRVGEDFHYRVWGKQFDVDESTLPESQWFDAIRATGRTRGFDGWKGVQAGFRADWQPTPCDTITFQGDYTGVESALNDVVPSLDPPDFVRLADEPTRDRNMNGIVRWRREIDDESDWTAQLYYDHISRLRNREVLVEHIQDIMDFDIQYRFPLGCNHSAIAGFRYRLAGSIFNSEELFLPFIPPSHEFNLISYFVQDTITLRDDELFLTLGAKLEHYDVSGFDYQPSVRLLWALDERRVIWGAVSRAVRTPPLYERFIRLTSNPIGPEPTFPRIFGNPDTVSEELIAYELGMRAQPTERFSWDLAAFYNDYENLQTITFRDLTDSGPPPGTPPLFYNLLFTNNGRGETYGFELSADYEVTPSWRLHGSYSFHVVNTETDPGSDLFSLTTGSTPKNQVYAQSSWDLNCCTKFDLMFRYVDHLERVAEGLSVPSYLVMDARLAWEPREGLEFAVVGRNLLDRAHPEYAGDTATEVEREVYGMVTWRY